jgi:hypothetical protein
MNLVRRAFGREVPYAQEFRLEALVSRKLVYREVCSEGSETTNSGTDESERCCTDASAQKLDMRLNKPDEQAHHCDVQKPEKESVY